MSAKPLPCPLCGCEDVSVFAYSSEVAFAITCDRCHLRVPGPVDRWNTRPATVPRGAVEALRHEVGWRIAHGAESNGHLEHVRGVLDKILWEG